MNICLCFGYFPSTIVDKIVKDTKCYLQNSADVLQKKFLEGISCYCNSITIVNAPFVGYYPFKYRSIYVPESYFHYSINGADVDVRSFSFNTLMFLTHKERQYKCKKELQKWLLEHSNEENSIIVYSVHMDFILACAELKKKYKFKLIVIVPDLPRYLNTSSKWYSKLHYKINQLTAKDYTSEFNSIDGFVYLTEQMNCEICKEYRPYIVIEGMVSNQINQEYSTNKREKYILYTGTMAKKYGIMNLVEAFTKMSHNTDYKLCLCGSGDAVDEIKELSKQYNIDYKGEITNTEAVELQKHASLLINPRLNEGEYTKYSFPSKIMEYMASGTPVAMHRLSGIPHEYYDYCYAFNESTPIYIAQQLDEILDIDESQRLALGKKAQKFVFAKKNAKSQCAKLIELLEMLS